MGDGRALMHCLLRHSSGTHTGCNWLYICHSLLEGNWSCREVLRDERFAVTLDSRTLQQLTADIKSWLRDCKYVHCGTMRCCHGNCNIATPKASRRCVHPAPG